MNSVIERNSEGAAARKVGGAVADQGLAGMSCACCSPRRRFLTGIAALGASVLIPAAESAAQAPAVVRGKAPLIDVHHHFYPPEYMQAWQAWLAAHGGRQVPSVQNWTIARTLEEMDRNGVTTSVLSLASTPGIWFGGDAQSMRRMSRLCNDYAARMARDHPGRFGLFASLPMPDVEGSLKEIEYAFDVLKADGIGLPTSYGDKWPGDPAYRAVFEELNRRKALVVFHPLVANCCRGLVPDVEDSWIEYPYDTARTMLSLLMSGTLTRLRDLRFVMPQAGGALPMLAGRINTLSRASRKLAEVAPGGIDAEFRKLYYETANSAYPPSMAALLKYVSASQVLFGSDFPYVSVTQNIEGLRKIGLAEAELRAIEAENAVRLMPRLRG